MLQKSKHNKECGKQITLPQPLLETPQTGTHALQLNSGYINMIFH